MRGMIKMGKDGVIKVLRDLHTLVILDDIQRTDTIVQYDEQNFNYFNLPKHK